MVDTQAITVRLPRDLYEWLRHAAFDGHTSQAAVILAALTAYKDRQEQS